MNIETKKNKLKKYRDDISKFGSIDSNFNRFVGIDLYDFIMDDEVLSLEFNKRLRYLDNLSEEKNFNCLQDNLFEVIQEILKLTSVEKIEKKQKVYNNKMIDKLKSKDKEKDFLTLPELYIKLQNKDNYLRLGERVWAYSDGEVSTFTPVIPIRGQYEINVQGFFNIIFADEDFDKKISRHLYKLSKKYQNLWYKFDEQTYRIPIKLHVSVFEEVFNFCIRAHPRKGYEFQYNFHRTDKRQVDGKKFNLLKKNCQIVVDDLIEYLETKSNNIQQKNKYSKTEELIEINKLGIKIEANYIKKGGEKKKISDTKKIIIYSLYYPFLQNKDEFFRVEQLQKKIGKIKVASIRNRISEINKEIRCIAIKHKKTTLGYFIESKTKRGYRLNPKIMNNTQK